MKKVINALFDRPYFFDEGIYFECQRCCACCTGDTGTVYVDQREIAQISHYLEIPQSFLIQHYLYPFQDSYSIREDAKGQCLFLQKGCTIYPVRPRQCKTYPFWLQNLRSEKNWQKVSRECPGIGKGSLMSKEEILSLIKASFRQYP